MRQVSACGAITAAIALLLWSVPALAESLGGYRGYCQQQANGRVVCKQVAGSAGVAGSAPISVGRMAALLGRLDRKRPPDINPILCSWAVRIPFTVSAGD